jgi:enoyl-CoA hydratase/carnithine racemase
MAYTDILYGVDDFVATITLNRPDKLNAWTAEDVDVRHAIESAAADDSVRAIVLTGAGRGFCAGADISRLSRLSAGFEQKFSYFLSVPKPILPPSTALSPALPSASSCSATSATWLRTRN